MVFPLLRLCALGALLLLTLGAARAAAQDPDQDREPIAWFAADVRGMFAKYPGDPALPPFLDVTEENLAKRGLGVVFGAHVYPLRMGRRIALGVGAEMFFSRGSKTLKPEQEDDEEKLPDGPTVDARLSGFSPQLSLNFGGREGWSYLTGGIGWTKFSTEVKLAAPGTPVTPVPPATPDAPAVDEPTDRVSTINYGGGARWFMKRHLAFTLDLRFYRIKPREATPKLPAMIGTRLLVLSAGVSFK